MVLSSRIKKHLKKDIPFLIILLSYSLLLAGAPDTLWTRTYGENGTDKICTVKQINDGGFIIAGRTYPLGAGSYDIYLARTDSLGDTLWTRTYGGDGHDDCMSLSLLKNNGFLLAGSNGSLPLGRYSYLLRINPKGDTLWTKSYLGQGLERAAQFNAGIELTENGFAVVGVHQGSISLVKTNSLGDTIWINYYDSSNDYTNYSKGKSIQQTSDSGFIIVGSTRSSIADNYDIQIIRTDKNGDMLWTKTYGGTESDIGHSIQITNDGGFVIGGFTNSYGYGGFDSYLIRVDSEGDTLWTKTYGTSGDEQGYSVQQTTDSGFIITGYTSVDTKKKADVYIVKTDYNGEILWTKTVGDTGNDIGYSLQQTTDGGFIIAGITTSFGSDRNNAYLIRLNKETTNIKNIDKSKRLTVNSMKNVKRVEIYDLLGRKIYSLPANENIINWTNRSGIYIVRYLRNNNTLQMKIILK